jgi:hypothetical protein
MQFNFPFLVSRRRRRLIPVLSYHGLNAPGTEYSNNDHVALEEDLRLIKRLGFRVAPLTEIARFASGRDATFLTEGNWVGLSFDDGTDRDYLDMDHPHLGRIKSFYTILKDSGRLRQQAWPQPTGVSFVIASPEARAILDRTCIAGQDDWRDDWWPEAARSGVLGIGNHSWDHTHTSLDVIAQRDQRKGTFLGIDNLNDADAQIGRSEEYIRSRTGGLSTGLFAYPYGEAPDYLVDEYFPNFPERHHQVAAFTTAGEYVESGGNRWKIPRFMCGAHWKTPDELEKILMAAKN